MTDLAELFRGVEARHFWGMANIASDLRTFLRAVAAQLEAQRLYRAMSSQTVRNAVCNRAIELAASRADPAFEHPMDVALATYVYLLNLWERHLAVRAATAIHGRPKLWWAQNVVDRVLASQQFKTDSGVIVVCEPSPILTSAAGTLQLSQLSMVSADIADRQNPFRNPNSGNSLRKLEVA